MPRGWVESEGEAEHAGMSRPAQFNTPSRNKRSKLDPAHVGTAGTRAGDRCPSLQESHLHTHLPAGFKEWLAALQPRAAHTPVRRQYYWVGNPQANKRHSTPPTHTGRKQAKTQCKTTTSRRTICGANHRSYQLQSKPVITEPRCWQRWDRPT